MNLPVGSLTRRRSKWVTGCQRPITFSDSEPEPDVVSVVRGPNDRITRATMRDQQETELVVEVSDRSLQLDQGVKLEIYAAGHIPRYWIVNLIDCRVEVYTEPRGGKKPTYKQLKTYGIDEEVPLVIDGKEMGRIPVKELLTETGTPSLVCCVLRRCIMPEIVLTEEQAKQLAGGFVPVVVKDPAGNVLGQMEPALSPEFVAELKRRSATPGPRYSGAHIEARLAALHLEWERTGGFDAAYLRRITRQIGAIRTREIWPQEGHMNLLSTGKRVQKTN